MMAVQNSRRINVCPSHIRQSGTNQQDTVYDVAIGMDGSMFLTGDTSGDWDGANKGKTDFIVIKLDADGKEMWRWQVSWKTC